MGEMVWEAENNISIVFCLITEQYKQSVCVFYLCSCLDSTGEIKRMQQIRLDHMVTQFQYCHSPTQPQLKLGVIK